ncbi:MBL fold metallo-hydrolase [Actinomadura fibrosa]|uniref:MBL fold metallo-hydrolase n=1 Tax=Actinomadura fibrosa TaxID=111802 RepID=A0ABW2XUH5_9ACTN|nr:MBL fold metallo-hydrolase [Actinomadura fibrosa]
MASLTYLGHATALLDVGGVRVLTDPVLRDRVAFLRRVVPPVPREACAAADVVLISHLHHDHCDLPSLAALEADPMIIAPPGGDRFLRAHGFGRVVALRPGESHTAGPVRVTAAPAVHDGRRRPFGPGAGAVGYLVTTADAAAYFAGDTGLFDGMRDLCPRLDLALVPVWGWGPNLGDGHLDPHAAAEAVARLRPRVAVPVHWGTFFPYGLAPFFRNRLRRPGHDFAAAVRARRLRTEVRVLPPGGGMTWHA